MALQVRERVCICVLPSLVAHTIGYGMAVSALNTVYVQTHLAGSTMFAWYIKRRHLQSCLCFDASGRIYNARLAWSGGTVLQVRRAWQGTVLGIAVDSSALPYLLRLIPGPTPSGASTAGRIIGWRKGVKVGLRSHHDQAFRLGLRPDLLAGGVGRELDHGLSLSLCIWTGPDACCRCTACWAEFCRETGPLRTPGL